MVPRDLHVHVWLSALTKHEPKPLPNIRRVSYRGWGAGISPPLPPRNLEIDYGYYCGAINISYLQVTGHTLVPSKCCLESLSQIMSEAIWNDLNSQNFSGGGMPPDPPSSHACLHTLLSSRYHPVSPYNSKSWMKP